MRVEDALYSAPPTTPIKLEDLEDAVKRRFQVLMDLYRGTLSSSSIEPLRDLHAHFGLRVIFATMPEFNASIEHTDLCSWYIDQETKLFCRRVMRRLKHSNPASVRTIVRETLRALNASYEEDDAKHLLVPFQDVPNLVRTRSVLLHAGLCRIPYMSNEATVVVGHHAHRYFAAMLQVQARACRVYREDLKRLDPVRSFVLAALRDSLRPALDRRQHHLSHLPRVSCDDDLRAAAPFLPLCMRYLADKLRQNHHLKYDGRRQLGLFLKGVGFTVEENLLFWRAAFHPLTSPKTFDKKYAYNIRHSYGLVGSRVVYDPMACDTIQKNGPPGAGQFHGCPFLHWDRAFLRTQLAAYGVPRARDIAATTGPSAACLTHLRTVCPSASSWIAQGERLTPNSWFDVARMCGPAPAIDASSSASHVLATTSPGSDNDVDE